MYFSIEFTGTPTLQVLFLKHVHFKSNSSCSSTASSSIATDIRTLFQKIKNRHTTCLFFYFALRDFMLSLFCHARKKKSVIFYAFFYTIDLIFLSSTPLVSTVLSKVSGYQTLDNTLYILSKYLTIRSYS